MKGTNQDIADSKGFGVMMLANIGQLFLLIPIFILSGRQVIKKKQVGGYFYTVGYGKDILGNKLIAPHANETWITPDGHKFGQDEPISKAMAINLYNVTMLPKMVKWIQLVETADKNHMAKTLIAHEVPFNQERLDEVLAGVMAIKQLFTMKEKIYTTIGVLAVGIPLNYYLPFSAWAIGFDVIMGTLLIFVWRR